MRIIVVYGGAFNPPTKAHQKILQAGIDWALNRDANSEVWLLPSGENNKKKTGIPRQKRLDYCQALIDSIDSRGTVVKIELLELDDTKPTDKIDTVIKLSRQNPDANLWWLYGADSLETINLWGGNWLKANTNMLIAPRDNAPITDLPDGSEVLDVATSGCLSSTSVRSLLASGKGYNQAVPPAVAAIIDPRLYSQYLDKG